MIVSCFYRVFCLVGWVKVAPSPAVIAMVDGFRVATLRSGYLLSVNGFVSCYSLVLLYHGL